MRRPIIKGSFDSKKEHVWFTKQNVGAEAVGKAYKELGDILGSDAMKEVTGHGGRACLVTYSLLNGVTLSAV